MLLFASCALGLVWLSSCAPEVNGSDGLSVVFHLDPDVPRVGPTTLEVRLYDGAGQPVRGGTLVVEGNMSHAGMRPSFADLVESAEQPGLYRGELEFTMGGDWFLLLEARWPDGRLVERQLDVPGVRAP